MQFNGKEYREEWSKGLGLIDMFCLFVIALLFVFINAHETELKGRKITVYKLKNA